MKPGETFNFTKKDILNLPLPPKKWDTYRDEQSKYLRLRVSYKGLRTFYYVRKIDGKMRWIKLGNFPEMTIFLARQKSMEHSGEVAKGNNPAAEKKERRNILTFGELFRLFLELHSKPHKKSSWFDEMCFRCYLSQWDRKPLSEITPTMLTKWHTKLGETNGKAQANRTLQLVRAIFNFGIRHQYIEGINPCLGVTLFKEKSRDRFLSPEEMKRFFEALKSEPNDHMHDFFALCLFTGARRGNVQAMRWKDVNLDEALWIIPDEESKSGEPMKVILVPVAVGILKERKKCNTGSEYVFPNHRSDSKTPHLVEPKKSWKRLCERAGLNNLRIHDLRRTLGSWQAALGSGLPIIGDSLGHKDYSTTAIYARLNLDPIRASVNAAVDEMLKQNK